MHVNISRACRSLAAFFQAGPNRAARPTEHFNHSTVVLGLNLKAVDDQLLKHIHVQYMACILTLYLFVTLTYCLVLLRLG
jgi:hypothetical protein